jgi:phosphoribosylanthranilate isomerase
VDALLLDAWSAAQHGGTGERLPLQWLQSFSPDLPWWLAGGIGPANAVSVLEALALAGLQPTGLDASSSVEYAPGDKDVAAVARLVAAVRGWTQQNP